MDLDGEREQWATVALARQFDSCRAIEVLGRTVMELVLEGQLEMAVEVRRATDLSAGAMGTLVSAAALARSRNGCVVVTCANADQAARLEEAMVFPHLRATMDQTRLEDLGLQLQQLRAILAADPRPDAMGLPVARYSAAGALVIDAAHQSI